MNEPLKDIRIRPTSQEGKSLLQWGIDSNGIPKHSVEIETEAADLMIRLVAKHYWPAYRYICENGLKIK